MRPHNQRFGRPHEALQKNSKFFSPSRHPPRRGGAVPAEGGALHAANAVIPSSREAIHRVESAIRSVESGPPSVSSQFHPVGSAHPSVRSRIPAVPSTAPARKQLFLCRNCAGRPGRGAETHRGGARKRPGAPDFQRGFRLSLKDAWNLTVGIAAQQWGSRDFLAV